MPCKNCNDCKDNGCAPTVYPKCLLMDKKYTCLGVNIGDTSVKLFDALEAACQAGWGGGGTALTFNNGLTKSGSVVQWGGTLLHDTSVDTLTKELTVGSLSGLVYRYGSQWSENFGGPGVPGVGFGIFSVVGNNESTASSTLQGGVYTGNWTTTNGANLTQLSLDDKRALLKYSPDNGVTNILISCNNNEITLDGFNRRAKLNRTQIQEAASAPIASTPSIQIDTAGNLFPISGSNGITSITGPGATLAGIQAGTRITLQFGDATPGTVQHGIAPPPGAAGIYLNGCVNFTPSQGDTLTLIYNGTDWSEIGRKACLDSPESWKIINTGGTMRNGESIPAFTAAVTLIINGRLRQADSAHAEINFSGNVEVNGLGLADLFFMPIGYRGTNLQLWQIAAVSSTSTDTAIGNIFVDSGTGEVRLSLVPLAGSPDTNWQIHWSTLIPTD